MTKIKPSTIAVYVSVFAVVVMMVSIGYHEPKTTTAVVANATSVEAPVQTEKTSVDDVVATTIAANVAQSANISVAPNAANLAISTQISSDVAKMSDSSTSKPQNVDAAKTNREIISYTAKAGDTVQTLSAKYNISTQTIKWTNSLTSDIIEDGKVLKILPVDGVLYNVKPEDTIDSIATKYGVNKTQLTLYNDLDVSGLIPNATIILPSANLPENEQPGYVAPIVASSSKSNYYFQAGSVGNRYVAGNCTWYAYERRAQLGIPVGSFWGNANTWAIAAYSSGYLVDNTPKPGAVLVDTSGYYGHVAVVESINSNGDIIISEMNNSAYGGLGVVNNRTISYGQAVLYRYIH